MIVVSNTSPIINLAAIGQLQLLEQLYSKIILPEAVRQEIVVKGIGQAGPAKIDESKWIEVKTISNPEFIQALQLELDKVSKNLYNRVLHEVGEDNS